MRQIELWTGSMDGQPHGFVAVVDIAPFPDSGLPDVIVWGSRTFKNYAIGFHGRPRYVEAFAVVSLTESSGRPLHDETCPDDCMVMHPPPPADRSQVTTLHGMDPHGDEHRETRADGMQKDYVVLTAEERAKGFVRPVRHSYRHVGRSRATHPLRDLTAEELERYAKFGYVKFEEYPKSESSSVLGRYWTERDLKGGCGQVTTMGRALAETYARDPKFYSGTFCASCKEHFAVGADGEFVWEGTDERVGT